MTMQKFIEPKSDQLNADDLVSGPRILKITKVKVTSEAQQACTIWYESHPDRPWKPCKTMGRVIVEAWGMDPQNYVGKYVKVYRDPEAIFGGQKVGGIRIMALSDIESPFTTSVTVSRGSKKPVRIEKLVIQQPRQDQPLSDLTEAGKLAAGKGTEEYKTWFTSLTATEKKSVEAQHAGWKTAAGEVDKANMGEPDPSVTG